MDSLLDQRPNVGHLVKNEATITTSNYKATVHLIDDELLYSEKSHQYKKNIYHESYASDWFIALSNLPKERVKLRSGNQLVDLYGPTLIFQPPFSLLEMHVEEGPLSWSCLGSISKIPFDITRPTFITNSEFSIPKTKQDVYDLLGRLRDATVIIQERYPSAVAEKLKAYIDIHFREEMKISSIANELNYSRVVMTRAFTKVYGISPVEYRHKIRIHEALVKVRYGHTITEALYEVGFSDPSQFIVHFKNILNAVPNQYKINRQMGRII